MMDALLPRALLRHLMREHGVAVPGRAATTAEQERLLASLVAEGLTNRELAGVLTTTEKSVEAKLTRLFQRTGYRSRVELATAMLTGEYR
jgi:DNA-binding NarL/FixJ family response regulator